MPDAPGRVSRLLIASELFAPGGVQQVGREAMAALSRHSEPLEVWTLRDSAVPDGFTSAQRSVRCAAGSRARLVSWALRAAAVSCPQRSVMVMHAHLAPIALPLQLRGASVSVMLHGVEVWRPLTAAERAVMRRSRLLIANSRHTADRFREANPGLASIPIAICPLGVPELASVSTERVDADAALIVSRLSSEDRYKGHDALLRAWPIVRAQVPSARLIVAGDGDDRPRLEALARDLDLSGAVAFVGHLSDGELERWYARCAFFVLPSTNEGFGLVYLEAMRAGKACLACAGAAAEIVEPETTGLIVPNQQVEVLAAALIRLYTNAELRQKLGDGGLVRWRERFTAAHFAARFEELTRTVSRRAA